MYKFLVITLLLLACKPNKMDNHKESMTFCSDTFIDFSKEQKEQTNGISYVSFLKKPLSVLCKHFNTAPTDTIFLLEEEHSTWRQDFKEADYNHLAFVFGKDSILKVWVSFIPHSTTFPVDTNYFHKPIHTRHITQKDFKYILNQECYGIFIIQKDTIKSHFYVNHPMPIEDMGNFFPPIDTSHNVVICPKIGKKIKPDYTLNYYPFFKKPLYLFLEIMEKKSSIQKMNLVCMHNTLAYIHGEREDSISFQVACHSREPTLPNFSHDTTIILEGKKIHTFMKYYKNAFEEPIDYITFYANYREIGHICEQSKIGK